MVGAFEKLKNVLSDEVELAFPDYSVSASKFELYVDALGYGAGATLVQVQDGKHRVIAYSSMSFNSAEKNYSTIERELAAIRWAVQNLRPFLCGVPFLLFTDHKPLLYLNNMSPYHSRLARTMDELADFDFEIRYKPGVENTAADYLSRLPDSSLYTDEQFRESDALPEGLQVIKLVEGGGNSLFDSLIVVLNNHKEFIDSKIEVPIDHLALRETLVGGLMNSPQKYGLKVSSNVLKSLKCMRMSGQLCCMEVLLEFSDMYSLPVYVHYGIGKHVVFWCYKCKLSDEIPKIHIQCLAGIHFNPLRQTLLCKKEQVSVDNADMYISKFDCEPNVNLKASLNNIDKSDEVEVNLNIDEFCRAKVMFDFEPQSNDEVALKQGDIVQILLEPNSHWWMVKTEQGEGLVPSKLLFKCDTAKAFNNCEHNVSLHSCTTSVYCQGYIGCGLIDSGAEICLVSEKFLKGLHDTNFHVDYCQSVAICGVGKGETSVIGITKLPVAIQGMDKPVEQLFAVVKDDTMPYCYLLGSNFINNVDVAMDFSLKSLVNLVADIQVCSRQIEVLQVFVGNSNSEYIVNLGDIQAMQSRDSAVKQVLKRVKESLPTKRWGLSCLKQFIPYAKKLTVSNDILLFENSIPVVSFPFLVNFVKQCHDSNAHVGSGKLIYLVRQHVWHPAFRKVCQDVAISCKYCQMNKVCNQIKSPPVLKIDAKVPFEMLVVDLVVFPKTSTGFVGCFVAIDQQSKWLSAVPIRNKTGITVAQACERVITALPKCPSCIRSDNGPEFRSESFEELLKSYNIKHIFSTPYHPSSCGVVERVNRTIKELLKAQTSSLVSWDKHLSRAIYIYNHTVHTELKLSPSDYVMSSAHESIDKSLVPGMSDDRWSEGNPAFIPYKVGQKVLYKIPYQGRETVNKLKPLYAGPFEIIKVQPNSVTYEIRECNNHTHVIRAHYTQLRNFILPPKYLLKYYVADSDNNVCVPVGDINVHNDDNLLYSTNLTMYYTTTDSSDTEEDCGLQHHESVVSVPKSGTKSTPVRKRAFRNRSARKTNRTNDQSLIDKMKINNCIHFNYDGISPVGSSFVQPSSITPPPEDGNVGLWNCNISPIVSENSKLKARIDKLERENSRLNFVIDGTLKLNNHLTIAVGLLHTKMMDRFRKIENKLGVCGSITNSSNVSVYDEAVGDDGTTTLGDHEVHLGDVEENVSNVVSSNNNDISIETPDFDCDNSPINCDIDNVNTSVLSNDNESVFDGFTVDSAVVNRLPAYLAQLSAKTCANEQSSNISSLNDSHISSINTEHLEDSLDVITDKSANNQNVCERRQTRSQGPVKDFPNVQIRPIEFRRKSEN